MCITYKNMFKLLNVQDKELIVVFVYDCERVQKEEDDPQDAVVYFYPAWVSAQQRLALCGQLMGLNQFLSTAFSSPNIIALQTGKFAMKSLGRFTMCIGTDRNTPDLVLDARIKTLHQLIRFYHKDFETISNLNNVTITEKLTKIFESYLPVVQCAGNIFGSIATFNLPKSASHVFLEAIQTLQCFQATAGVLGGAILHQNKVVASQLSADLTKLLVLLDPYRQEHLPAEGMSTQFRLPVGVQLIIVYVEHSELVSLQQEASTMSDALKSTAQLKQNVCNKDTFKAMPNKEVPSNSTMNISRIFTVVEEAEVEVEGESIPHSQEAVEAPKHSRMMPVAPECFVIPHQITVNQAQTTDNLPDSCQSKINIRYCSFGRSASEGNGEDKEAQEELRPYYNTITDSTMPLFRHNGLPASQTLYNTRVGCHYSNLNKNHRATKKKCRLPTCTNGHMEEAQQRKLQARLALNLPLSSATTENTEPVPGMAIPLTPLMAKLSLLAVEQRSTPLAAAASPLHQSRKSRPRRQREINKVDELDQRVLYVCGYKNIKLFLLLDCETSQNPDLIHSLWEKSMSSMGELDHHLLHCLEHFPSSSGCCESYSYLTLDPMWGTTQRGGAWAGPRLDLLTTMHQQFLSRPHITEATVRTEDSIIYGCQCGGVEVFYQQGCSATGLPAPSDPLGIISLKAKRRLERDHGIILL